jgi:orotidine-5'-phosphate decarboxylase
LPSSFGVRLGQTFERYGQLCVGIDPHANLLEDWGLSDSPEGLRQFAFTALRAAAGRVGIIKPQVSFFERHGSAGFKVLEDLCVEAQNAGLLVILDAKRGDIGTTMQAYFDAWLGKAAPFVSDALTVSPYLGFDSMLDIYSQAAERGKGIIVLCATSNPEGAALQQATMANGQSVAANIWQSLGKINEVTQTPGEHLGSFGAVIGATLRLKQFGLGELDTTALKPAANTFILAPGFGAQGARLSMLDRLFGAASPSVIASVSRSVLGAGPLAIDEAIDAHIAELSDAVE